MSGSLERKRDDMGIEMKHSDKHNDAAEKNGTEREATGSGRQTGQTDPERLKLLSRVRAVPELYVIMSVCTKVPYVVCDPDTYDDEIFLFFDPEEAKAEVKGLIEDQIPVHVAKLEDKHKLMFFTGLYTMGVNAIVLCDQGEETVVQIGELARKKEQAELPEGTVWVENPQLHLTAIYLAQEMRSRPGEDAASKTTDLQEELAADFTKGSYIFALQTEGKATPTVKLKDGVTYQPIFTDILEFQKFNRENKFRPVVVKAEKIPQVLAAGVKGVILNILGVNLPLLVNKKTAKPEGQPQASAVLENAVSESAASGNAAAENTVSKNAPSES